MKTFEDPKDLLLEFRVDAYPVVVDRKPPFVVLQKGRDMNAGWLIATIPYRISDEILKNLLQLEFVQRNPGQAGADNRSTTLFYRDFQIE